MPDNNSIIPAPPCETLRQYQREGIENIFSLWRKGKRSILFQMPTGTGKTVLFAEIVRMGFQQQRKILIVVHRIELVDQITRKLKSRGVEVGHIVAGKQSDYSRIVQVASIQTLSRREHPEANLIIIDECHHAKAATYKKLWELYPDAKFLGVTATPVRLSGEGFSDLFDELIVSMSILQFIEKGFLVKIKHHVGAKPRLEGVKVRHGDYVTSMLSGIMMDNSMMIDLIESYCQQTPGKSAIVFAVDVEHSQSIAERYREADVNAAHIDAKTPKAIREQILSDFRKGIIKVVSNVEIITEGFDFPECEVVQLARPTKSLALYLQMVGRVMRPAKGKTEGIVLDNAGLWLEHNLSVIDRTWSLEGLKKKKRSSGSDSGMIAVDNEGNIREVNRNRPSEIKGLCLLPLEPFHERLLIFESFFSIAVRNNHKPLAPFYRYAEYLETTDQKFIADELLYISRRINRHCKTLPEEQRFKTGFWFVKFKELFPDMLEREIKSRINNL